MSYSASIPTGQPVLVLSGAQQRLYQRIINVGTVGGGVAWLSYDGTPAPNTPGSFPLAPFGNARGIPSTEEFKPIELQGGNLYASIPSGDLKAVSDGGTSGTSPALLTVSAY